MLPTDVPAKEPALPITNSPEYNLIDLIPAASDDVYEPEPEPELLRNYETSKNKVLSGSLSDYCNGDNAQELTLQVTQIVQTDDDITVIVSDGHNWIKCDLDAIYWDNVESGQLSQFDIIRNVVLSGKGYNSVLLKQFCRPKSIQLKRGS